MGIQGLLPALKSTTTPVNVKEYGGMRAAVDTYSWLHKAAFSCSRDICHGLATKRFIDYCIHRINLLRHYGVKPVLVFDGGKLPMKHAQDEKRSRTRKEHLQRALDLEAAGNHAAAYEAYQKAVDITPAIAHQLIEALRSHKVDFIVAPYEADAQLAYLALSGLVDVVITEDSDLIAYGCPRILFKMDKYGQGVEFQYADLVKNKELSFINFTKRMVLEMCILSGCDYLPSLPGMGIKRAHSLIKRFRSYGKVIRHLRFSGITITKVYEETFEKAVRTFCHQPVYDPVLEDITNLTKIPQDFENADLEFLGPKLHRSLVKQIAHGFVDPVTHMPFLHDNLSACGAQENVSDSLQMPIRQGRSRQLDLPAQKNVLTNYFTLKSSVSQQQFKTPRMASELVEAADSPSSKEYVDAESPSTPARECLLVDCVPVTPEDEIQQDVLNCARNIQEANTPEHSFERRRVLKRSPYFPAPDSVYIENNGNDGNDAGSDDLGPSNQKKRHSVAETKLGSSKRCKIRSSFEATTRKFSSSLLGTDMDKTVSLSANVRHVKEYSSIAQSSLEKFAAAISSFKCTSGARVSGLRAPQPPAAKQRRISGELFKEFALTEQS